MIRPAAVAAALCLATALAAAEPPAPIANAATLSVIDAAIGAGRLEDARDIIARSKAQQDGPELRLRAAELALANNAMPEARESFAALVADPVVGARASQGMGLVHFRAGEMAAAQQAFETATTADPSLIRSWIGAAVIADRARDFARADVAYARALAIDPRSAAALTNRGYSLLLRRRYAEAEADLAQAVAIEPQLAVAQTNLRLARAMQGRYREAFNGSTKATLANDLNTVGFGAMARGDNHTAETYFNRALALNTRFDPVAWANLRYLKSITQPLGTGVTENTPGN